MSSKPNVLWVFGDQHRAQALSTNGDPNVSTPTCDRMAIEGVNFHRATSNNPWCTPFRYMLFSGQYSHTGCYKTPSHMPKETKTAAHYMKDAGYHTMYVGKWHLYGRGPEGADAVSKENEKIIPRDHRGGFDTFIGYENNNSQYDCYVHGHDADNGEMPTTKLPTYETDALTDIMLDQLQRQVAKQQSGESDQPFFGVLSVQPPHGPTVAPREDMARHRPGTVELRPNVPPVDRVQEVSRRQHAGYYAQIENLDWNLGRLQDELDRLGVLHNTHIIFFSDHGDCMGSHGYFEKSSPWEESIRVPFIMGGMQPYKEKGWGRCDAQISAVDILPTTLGLIGEEKPGELPGFDYSPYRLQKRVPSPLPGEPDSVYIQHVVRKYLLDGLDRAWRGVVMNDGWKYVCIPGAPYGMYNLNEDPYEMNNLAFNQRFVEKRTELQARLAQWIEETGDEFELPEI